MSNSLPSNHSESSESIAPEHIAIIMDGNGRWAKKRGLPRIAGHRAGAEAVRLSVEACKKLGVQYLTLYAFSADNWKRPESEINALMQLLERFLKDKTKQMMKQGVRLNAIGRTDMLPEKTQKQLSKAIDLTRENSSLTVNLALSYGSREEIVDATKIIAQKVSQGEISIDQIDTKTISSQLYTAGQPDPDLLIRTSGEMRLSNFLLWQLSYAEIIILEKYWPEFDAKDIYDAVSHFHSRQRRFGAI